jgi:hypothetical protein
LALSIPAITFLVFKLAPKGVFAQSWPFVGLFKIFLKNRSEPFFVSLQMLSIFGVELHWDMDFNRLSELKNLMR